MEATQAINSLNRYPEFKTRAGIQKVIEYLHTKELPDSLDSEWKKRSFLKRYGEGSGFEVRHGNKLFCGNREVVEPVFAARRLAMKSIYDDEKKGLGTGEMEFFQQVCTKYINIPKKSTDMFLKKQGDVRVATVPHRFPMTIRTSRPNERWGCDLIDMTMYPPTQNQNRKYIMTIVDYFSGKVWARGLLNRNNGLREDEQRENDEERAPPPQQVAENPPQPDAEQEAAPEPEPEPPAAEEAALPARRVRRNRYENNNGEYHYERQRVRDVAEVRRNYNRGGSLNETEQMTGGVDEHGRRRQANNVRAKKKFYKKKTAELKEKPENANKTDAEIKAIIDQLWFERVNPRAQRQNARAARIANRVNRQENRPLERVERNRRTPNTLLNALRSIIAEAGIEPRIIQVDNEFNQGGFRIFCDRRYHDDGFLKIIAVLSHQSFTNGKVERMNREIRKKTKAGFIRHNNLKWFGDNGELLQTYVANINSQKNSKTGRSPDEIWYSGELNEAPEEIQQQQEAQKEYIKEKEHNKKDAHQYNVGDKVRLNLLQVLPKMRKKRKSNFGWNQVAVHFSPEIYTIATARHYPESSTKQDEYTLKIRNAQGDYEPVKALHRPRKFRACDLIGVYHNSEATHLQPPDYTRAQFINRIRNPNRI